MPEPELILISLYLERSGHLSVKDDVCLVEEVIYSPIIPDWLKSRPNGIAYIIPLEGLDKELKESHIKNVSKYINNILLIYN
jgi:hypothetical protein